MIRFLCFILAYATFAFGLNAAQFSTPIVSGKQFIVISGELVAGDDRKFKNLAIGFDDAVVLLDSPGGLAGVGMEIGRTISIKGFLTAVGTDAVCASSCGLIWLAGRERFLYPSSHVGFHAVYRMPDGTPAVSSEGNALVGAYLRQLGFSDRVIIYVTQSAPASMQWLTSRDAALLGLPVTLVDAVKPASETSSNATASDSVPAVISHVPIPEPRPLTATVEAEPVYGNAYLYEQRASETPLVDLGKVEWRLSEKNYPAKGMQKYIVADVIMPARHFSFQLTIEPNGDEALSASHLVTLRFSYSPNFDHDRVKAIQRIALKLTEPTRGEALIGVAGVLSDDVLVYALNGSPEAVATNLKLLRTRFWLDIPALRESGQRSLLTLEKGEGGVKVFNEAMASWEAMSNATRN